LSEEIRVQLERSMRRAVPRFGGGIVVHWRPWTVFVR
jgi:hypothetical protein